MREIRREALVPFSAPDMFDLIERVEDYPQFLPWCRATQLLERTDDTVSATVEVGVRDLRVRVTTRNDKRAARVHGDPPGGRIVPALPRRMVAAATRPRRVSCHVHAALRTRAARRGASRAIGSITPRTAWSTLSCSAPSRALPRLPLQPLQRPLPPTRQPERA